MKPHKEPSNWFFFYAKNTSCISNLVLALILHHFQKRILWNIHIPLSPFSHLLLALLLLLAEFHFARDIAAVHMLRNILLER